MAIMKRIGIDVGGTVNSLNALIHKTEGRIAPLDAVMIGTTHFTNAVVQRRNLTRVAAVRIGLPASASLQPFVDWPDDLAARVRGRVFLVKGRPRV
jgi:N-methylhydantoinase A/oxoprolinase/acetone carboxylase beta subunit